MNSSPGWQTKLPSTPIFSTTTVPLNGPKPPTSDRCARTFTHNIRPRVLGRAETVRSRAELTNEESRSKLITTSTVGGARPKIEMCNEK